MRHNQRNTGLYAVDGLSEDEIPNTNCHEGQQR